MKLGPWRANVRNLLLATAFLLAVAPWARGANELVGRWVSENQFTKTVVDFLPDGRYGKTLTVGNQKLGENGTYALQGNTLTLNPQNGGAQQFSVALQGDQLALRGGSALTQTQEAYTRVPGSAEAVVAEAAKGDQANAQENAAWAARFPIGPARPQPNIAAGNLPLDPQPARVFDGAVAFTAMQLYSRYWNANVVYQVTEGADPGCGKNETRFHFLANGRFFYVNIKYVPTGVVQYGRNLARAEVTASWGRYTIGAGTPASEPLQMESDAGERIAAAFVSGRRNLLWGQNTFGNVFWEQAAMRQYQEHGGQPGVGVPLPQPAVAPQPAQPIQPANPEAAAALRKLREAFQTLRAAEAKLLADPTSSPTERLALRQACLDIEQKIQQLLASQPPANP